MLKSLLTQIKIIYFATKPELALLAFISVLLLFSFFGVIPSAAELSQKLYSLFVRYGVPLVAICSFLEGIVGINAYFPGAFTILTAMSTTSGDPLRGTVMFLVIFTSSFAANILSFYIGTMSPKAQRLIRKDFTRKKFWATYWHPQLASFTAFELGNFKSIIFSDFIRFAFPPCFSWNLFWGLVMYYSKLTSSATSSFLYVFLIYLILVIIWKSSTEIQRISH